MIVIICIATAVYCNTALQLQGSIVSRQNLLLATSQLLSFKKSGSLAPQEINKSNLARAGP